MGLDRSDNPISVTFCTGGVGLLISGGFTGFISINPRRKKSEFSQPTKGVEAQSAGGSGPLQVAHYVHVGHVFTTGCLPWENKAKRIKFFIVHGKKRVSCTRM